MFGSRQAPRCSWTAALRMIRARVPLCAQAVVMFMCVLGMRKRAETHSHPIGLEYEAYRWCTLLSLLLFGWVLMEAKMAKIQNWKFIGILILSFLMVLVTKFVTDSLMIDS